MKKLLSLLLTTFTLLACNEPASLTVSITNPLHLDRTGEMVEIPMEDITNHLHLADTAQVIVLNAEGEQVPYQITYNNQLIFPATVEANATATYTISEGTPEEIQVKACGRFYPERLDDMAWENDRVGFRAYGPALQAQGQKGFGYDIFLKRGTSEPVLEQLYGNETNKEIRTRIAELKKTDKEAATALSRSISYHIDHGYGMDCYAVGPTLGAGTSALMAGDTIVYPWCFKEYTILDNGPLRFTVQLEFHPFSLRTDTAVVETRIITLDVGSQLNRTVITYDHLSQATPIATGIVLHETDGKVIANAQEGYIAYLDPTQGPDNGKVMMGCLFPAPVGEAKSVMFPAEEAEQRKGAYGHVLAISHYEPDTDYTYYWGFAWDRAGQFQSMEQWQHYLADCAQKARYPLEVTM